MKVLLMSLMLMLNPFQAKAVPTFHLVGEIDATLAAKIIEFLDANPGNVRIVINSPGGSVLAGAAIEDAIEEHGSVTCEVRNGWAASMAQGIFQSCDKRLIGVGGLLMIHQAATSGQMDGRQNDFENQRRVLHAIDQAECRHTAKKSKLTADEICRTNLRRNVLVDWG